MHFPHKQCTANAIGRGAGNGDKTKELFQVVRMENGEIGADGKPKKTYSQRRKEPRRMVIPMA